MYLYKKYREMGPGETLSAAVVQEPVVFAAPAVEQTKPAVEDSSRVDNSSRNLIDKTERAGAEIELTPVPDAE